VSSSANSDKSPNSIYSALDVALSRHLLEEGVSNIKVDTKHQIKTLNALIIKKKDELDEKVQKIDTTLKDITNQVLSRKRKQEEINAAQEAKKLLKTPDKVSLKCWKTFLEYQNSYKSWEIEQQNHASIASNNENLDPTLAVDDENANIDLITPAKKVKMTKAEKKALKKIEKKDFNAKLRSNTEKYIKDRLEQYQLANKFMNEAVAHMERVKQSTDLSLQEQKLRISLVELKIKLAEKKLLLTQNPDSDSSSDELEEQLSA